MKKTNYLPLAAIAAAVALLAKKNSSVSGIGATNVYKAIRMIEDAGMDLNDDFYRLSYSDISTLVDIMRKCGYRAPSGRVRTGSPARYFWYYMQRVAK